MKSLIFWEKKHLCGQHSKGGDIGVEFSLTST